MAKRTRITIETDSLLVLAGAKVAVDLVPAVRSEGGDDPAE